MGSLFLKSINIKNYKCFEDETVEFNVPNGELGSGLNLLIGENGNGKTSVLEAINYTTQSSFAVEGRIKINDFNDYSKNIEITAYTEEFKCKMPYPGNYYEANGLNLTIKPRERKSPGRLLSSPFQITTYISNIHENYKNSKGEDSRKKVLPLYKLYGNDKIDSDEFNIFYFDKNRSRHLSTGKFKTTFDKICDDLNWKFLKNLDGEKTHEIKENVVGEYFKNVLEISQKGIGEKLSSELSSFFNENKEYKNLKVELLSLLHPFTDAFLALRGENELNQIDVRSLGSGIEVILTLLLLRGISNESKGTIIYLIDEPELHLHPMAQDALSDLLLEESKDKQIIISSHSPYLFKNLLDKCGVTIFGKDGSGKILQSKESSGTEGLFPWSPSWAEVNYKAFSMPTVEFHNELYGYLQEKEQKYRIDELDSYLVSKGVDKKKSWVKLEGGSPSTPLSVTLQTYIRHSIHHPENTENDIYTNEELIESVDGMIDIIKN